MFLLIYIPCFIGIVWAGFLIGRSDRPDLLQIWVGGSFILIVLSMLLVLGSGFGEGIQVLAIFLSSFVLSAIIVGIGYIIAKLEERSLKLTVAIIATAVISESYLLISLAIAGVKI